MAICELDKLDELESVTCINIRTAAVKVFESF
jgi:hypothetical protein